MSTTVKRLAGNRPVSALLVLLTAVYLLFLAMDLFFPGLSRFSGPLKYSGVLICLAIALLLHRSAWSRRDSALLIAALCFTALADLFLLLLNLPIPGLIAFCLAHLLYILRYRPAVLKPAAAAAVVVVAGRFAPASLVPGFPAEYALAGVYGALILAATVCAFLSKLPQTNRRLAVAGMALFLLCDVHVALFNVLSASSFYYPFASFLMWFFYLPAQALLAVSGLKFTSIAQ